MRFKVTLRRPAGDVDLTVTADATASVADVADQLAAGDPGSPGATGADRTLQINEYGGATRRLDPALSIVDSGLRSGARIAVASAGGGQTRQAAAVIQVIAGRDASKEISIPVGVSVIGRDVGRSGVDVLLTDPLVSKRHARITVGDAVEIVDLNSANGVVIWGGQVSRATVSAADIVVLGDTSLRITQLARGGASQAGGSIIDHVRSPRVVPRYPGREFEAPKPPTLAVPQRFPLVALAAPLIMGGVIYAIQPQIMAVLMMALSPVLLIGAWIDQKMVARRTFKQQKKQFDASMLRLQEKLEGERILERGARHVEAPSLAECRTAIEQVSPLLWTRRPEHAEFLAVRLGVGRSASRNEVVLPQGNETKPEFLDQLEGLRTEFAELDDVPILAELGRDGGLGVAGPHQKSVAVARGLMLQLAALHSPAELIVCALTSPASRPEWEWLKWLPHTASPHSPLKGDHLADGLTTGTGLLAELEGLVDQRLAGEAPTARGAWRPDTSEQQCDVRTPAVVVVVENDAPLDRGRLTRLAERGPDARVHLIWRAPSTGLLPAACRSFVELDRADTGGVAGLVRLGTRVYPVACEPLAGADAEVSARLLAPVVDVGSPVDDDSDLPSQVAYPSLAGEELLDSFESVVDKWRENNSLTVRGAERPVRRKVEGNLRALVGHDGQAPLYLDLRRQGPHALVGGTTGAGKSEFLQAWVLGMAAGHSPDRLTFLLVDYKGGAAFADCEKLPHTVGQVTDLSPHLVRRALTSLRAELKYREALLHSKQAKDLVSLEKTGDPDCPPSLVIVVDEFAALVQEVPEFVDGVVDVAQRGRSLGLHLILATQRPSGVIKDNLRANTNLRVALRMADTDDSTDILGDAMAAHFDPSVPGRAALKTGPGRLTTFQTGYAGGWTTNGPTRPRIDVAELPFGAGPAWEVPGDEAVEAADPGPTDIARMVATITRAAAEASVPVPRKPWLPELAPIYNLKAMSNPRTDVRLPLGVVDLPERQTQQEAFYEPDRDGNLAIFGASGSGKSTALRTLAAAAAFTVRGGPVHVYGLDFGSRGLRMLEDLPHVGAIIDGDDGERVVRLLRFLRRVVDERSALFAAVSAGSLDEYRQLAGKPTEPRYLLLIDGVGVFRERYEFGNADAATWFTAFAQIAADGRQLGVHVVMTGDRPNALSPSIAATVQRRIVLRLADAEEYVLMGVPKDVLGPSSPAGRAILDGTECQLALLGANPNVAMQAREIAELAASLKRAGLPEPVRIGKLPDQVRLADLPPRVGEGVVIGIDDVTLGPAALQPHGSLLLAGPPGSGRTTALGTIAAALARNGTRPVLLSPRRSPLSGSANWSEQATAAGEVAALAERLAARIESGAGSNVGAILIENLPDFTNGEAEFALDHLIQVALREGCFVVGEGETSGWSQAYTLSRAFKAGKAGLLLTPGDMDGDTLLGTPLGRIRRVDFPAGRGFLIASGRAHKLQVAMEGL